MQIKQGNWIKATDDLNSLLFRKQFQLAKPVKKATLEASALGVYDIFVNGTKAGDFILAPGFTSYNKRIQVQSFDVTSQLANGNNELCASVGPAWCVGRLAFDGKNRLYHDFVALISVLSVEYTDGTKETIVTDDSWEFTQGNIIFSDIYDGETYDARIDPSKAEWKKVVIADTSKDLLIPQEGEFVKEIDRLPGKKFFIAPNGDKVIDFGQNLTGYISFKIKGPNGHTCRVQHAEVLDKHGNFYTDNLRSAKQLITYTCNGEQSVYKPSHTFFGFRYIRLLDWPEEIDVNNFTAISVHSDMKRTGYINTSNPKINQLFSNIVWGQKGNFLDVPTDCPQRDERLGWTGDAQVFIKTASYNYDVEKFFVKWFGDIRADQLEDGGMPSVIPAVPGVWGASSSAWGDAAVICPWQIYLTYNNKDVLESQFESMKKWIAFIKAQGDNPYLWNSGHHFGDWVCLDGGTAVGLLGTAYFAYSTSILIKVGEILGKDMSEYKELYTNVRNAYMNEFIKDGKLTENTQTAHALTLFFGLCDEDLRQPLADNLAKLIMDNGSALSTGFVGTPYLLHVLSSNGYTELAFTLLLREKYPSWLFSVNMGATTIWEHWDGINENGDMWDVGMNSFNHYAYGVVGDWMYEVVAGIKIDEKNPGFKHFFLQPHADKRFKFFEASVDSRFGKIYSKWEYDGDTVNYTFEVPENTTATITLGDKTCEVGPGKHEYSIA